MPVILNTADVKSKLYQYISGIEVETEEGQYKTDRSGMSERRVMLNLLRLIHHICLRAKCTPNLAGTLNASDVAIFL